MSFNSFKLTKYLINSSTIVPSSKLTGISVQTFTFLKWKYSKEIKYEKCPIKKKEAEKNLNDLLGIYSPIKK